MTRIAIDIAKKLDGKSSYMAAIFVDSYGDKLLVEHILPDHQLNVENYFSPCPKCGVSVLDSSIVPESGGLCNHCVVEQCKATNHDHCMACMLDDMCPRQESNFESTPLRIRVNKAVKAGNAAFWDVVASAFPDFNTATLPTNHMLANQTRWVDAWLSFNAGAIEDFAQGMSLHFPSLWRMHNTGGGCMVVTSADFLFFDKPVYIGVTRDCVCLYRVTGNEDDFLNDALTEWIFGDNPAVLMNQLEDHLDDCINLSHLFDDIVTIGKSGKC